MFPDGSVRMWGAVSGPGSDVGDGTAYTLGVEFYATDDVLLSGYGWWCAANASTAAVSALAWTVDTPTTGTPVPGSDAVSQPLTAGAWNYLPLALPVQLLTGQRYRAGVQGAAGPNWYSATGTTFAGDDLVSGPLAFPSTAHATGGLQGSFWTSTTLTFPRDTSGNNYWVDVVVTPTAPPGTTARTYASGREPLGRASGVRPVSSAAGSEPATTASGRHA